MTHNDDRVVLEAEETIEKGGKAKRTSLLRAARLSLMPSEAESLTRIVYGSMPDRAALPNSSKMSRRVFEIMTRIDCGFYRMLQIVWQQIHEGRNTSLGMLWGPFQRPEPPLPKRLMKSYVKQIL